VRVGLFCVNECLFYALVETLDDLQINKVCMGVCVGG